MAIQERNRKTPGEKREGQRADVQRRSEKDKKRRREEKMKITNSKLQITNPSLGTGYKRLQWGKLFGTTSRDCPHMKSFCGVQGRFLQKEPLAAGGSEKNGK
jgi:hypothetical protein